MDSALSDGLTRSGLTVAAIFIAIFTGQAAIAGGIDVTPNFYDWTGVYVGGNVGYATGSFSETPIGATSGSTQAISGAVVGGQIGANFQYRSTLFGVEMDGDWSNQQGSGSSGTFLAGSIPWLATARFRIGFAYDTISYYATGGVGRAWFKSTSTTGAVFSSANTAWVAGVGQESVINRNLILRFEVLYLQLLGNVEIPTNPATSTQSVYDILVRVGLNYKFDWPGN